MVTTFYKWLLYLVSYFPIYVLAGGYALYSKCVALGKPVLERVYFKELFSISTIIFLVVVSCSLIIFYSINRFKSNCRLYETIQENSTIEIIAFLIPVFLVFLTKSEAGYNWGILSVVFLILGIIATSGDYIRLCPWFLYLGYKVYKSSMGNYIICRLSKDCFNVLIEENENGIEAKQLTKNVYIVYRGKF